MYSMILSNVTRIEKGSAEILQIGTDFEGLYISKLIDKFCQPVEDPSKSDPYQCLANVFTNVTQVRTPPHPHSQTHI